MNSRLSEIPNVIGLAKDNLSLSRVLPTDEAAVEFKALCSIPGLDASDRAFDHEPTFAATIRAGVSLSESEIVDRIESKYGGEDPIIVGFIVKSGEDPIGMAMLARCGVQWQDQDSTEQEIADEDGVNYGLWLVKDARNRSYGKYITWKVASLGTSLMSYEGDWQNKQLWTSIRKQNSASKALASDAFERVGEQTKYADKVSEMQRDVWLYKYR